MVAPSRWGLPGIGYLVRGENRPRLIEVKGSRWVIIINDDDDDSDRNSVSSPTCVVAFDCLFVCGIDLQCFSI